MKTIKKQISVLLAVMMILCSFTAISFSASAAETTGGEITVKSNLCDSKVYSYSANDKQIEVTYYLQCDEMLLNMQGGIYYDSSVLKIADTNTANTSIPNFASGNYFVNFDLTNKALFNATSLNLYDFTTKGVFFTVTFDIIGSGDTEVNLDVDVITATTANSFDELETASDIDLVYYGNIASDKFTFAGEGKLVSKPSAATIYFAMPRGVDRSDSWSGADLYYNSTVSLTNATRLPLTDTGRVIEATVTDTLTQFSSGNLDVYSVNLSESQIAEIDNAKSVGFVKAGASDRTGLRTGYSILNATTTDEYSSTKASIADFDGMTFVINSCYDTKYETATYTGKWVEGNGSKATEIAFAAPKGNTASGTWTGADLFYSSTTSIANATRISMTKSNRVLSCTAGTTKTLKPGDWSIYTLKLTDDQVAAINASKACGFAMKGSNVRTGMRTGYSLLNAKSDGSYSTTKSNIESFAGKTFVISGCYDTKYENTTYTGYWSNETGTVSTATATINFAAPYSASASVNWASVDFYYSVKENITDATRVTMTKTDKVLKVDTDLGTLKSGEWVIYTVNLTAEQVSDISDCVSVGFVKTGSNVRTGLRAQYSILNANETGSYASSDAAISDFDGLTFVINGCYDSKYELTTYTGYWTDELGTTATSSETIRFAAPTNWKGVNLFYNSTASVSGVKTIEMTKTAETKAVTVSGLNKISSGNWAIYEVTLTAEQIVALDKSLVVGFMNSASSSNRTGLRKEYSVIYATADGTYESASNSIIDYAGKTFVISGCYDSKYEAQTYTGYWE